MEKIKLNDTELRVAVYISPTTKDNEVHWRSTVQSSKDFERIKHVDIVKLRHAYDSCGYLDELLLVLKKDYPPKYPCATLIRNHELSPEEKCEFIHKINQSNVSKILCAY
ncbi:hypothetical protein LG358_00157 [Escherichia phage UoN_LG358_1]|nr:hypothetical protein LG358_00157 [Escherichia phage UoN_LG358_1]